MSYNPLWAIAQAVSKEPEDALADMGTSEWVLRLHKYPGPHKPLISVMASVAPMNVIV